MDRIEFLKKGLLGTGMFVASAALGNVIKNDIDELKELDRALMILYLETKTYNEIAEILGITETNVATKINRIKNNLKEKFATIKN